MSKLWDVCDSLCGACKNITPCTGWPIGLRPGLDRQRFGKFPWLVGGPHPYCPGRIFEDPKAKSTQPRSRGLMWWVILYLILLKLFMCLFHKYVIHTWCKTWTSGRTRPWRSACRGCAPSPAGGRWSWRWAASAGSPWPARPRFAPHTSARSAWSRQPANLHDRGGLWN